MTGGRIKQAINILNDVVGHNYAESMQIERVIHLLEKERKFHQEIHRKEKDQATKNKALSKALEEALRDRSGTNWEEEGIVFKGLFKVKSLGG